MRISVVIPTLQKNILFLKNLILALEKDPIVEEIIVIDNSLKGLEIESLKLRIITPAENLFVNPSELLKKERKIYKKHTLKWYQYIFDLEKRFNGYRIRVLELIRN